MRRRAHHPNHMPLRASHCLGTHSHCNPIPLVTRPISKDQTSPLVPPTTVTPHAGPGNFGNLPDTTVTINYRSR